MKRFLLALSAFLSLHASFTFATNTPLSEHPQWLALLHFDQNGLFSEPHSAVLDDNFFLSSNGRHDPQAELEATIVALRETPGKNEPHATCRFPARAMWLSRMTDEQWPAAKCPDWQTWQNKHAGARPGLVFASGYLGNPASFFGHLMLRLESSESPRDTNQSHLLNSSFNFGADVPPGEGMVAYMAQGLFGGYHAEFSQAPFYRNTTLYSEREMRDLWYYRLNLAEGDRKLLVAHLYEILGMDYDYLFLTQNCASRIARTLEVVVDDNLTPGHAPWVTPEALVRAISQSEEEGRPLLASVEYLPSRRLQTEQRYHNLSRQEQTAAARVWPRVTELDMNAAVYRNLEPRKQAAVLDTLLGHAAYLKQTNESATLAQIEQRLLQARLRLPAGGRHISPTPPPPLHQATPPGVVRLEGVHNDQLGEYARLTFRPLQYDLLDSNESRMPGAALEFGRTQLALRQGDPELQRLDIFRITNLHAQSVPLPELSGMAWHASGSIARSDLSCGSCLEAQANLLAGQSFSIGQHLPFALVGGQLRNERYQSGPLAPMVQLGILSDWTAYQRTLLKVTHTDAFKGQDGRHTRWSVQHRIALDTSLDIRAGVEGDRSAREINLGLSWYY